ncbi:hypothetical protein OAD81_01240 [Flavobacteriaceae bacterium]|nr:hypothetical protein [Flavobacteriaceae bacterium]
MKKIFLITIMSVLLSCDKDDIQNTVQYTLTVSASEGGTISTEGGTYDEGTEVTITATPSEGYFFAGWEGNDSTSESLTITLNSNQTFQALFELNPLDPIIGVWYGSGSFTNQFDILVNFETTLTYVGSGSATNESIFTGDFNQDGNTQTNNTTTEFSWENTSPGPDFNSLSYTYNNSTTNQQTGVVSTNAFIWDFAEDYNSAVTTTEAGVINNWTRR